VALVNCMLGKGVSIAPNQSQEVAELREEVATPKEELKALEDLFGKLSQISAISVSVPQSLEATKSGRCPCGDAKLTVARTTFQKMERFCTGCWIV